MHQRINIQCVYLNLIAIYLTECIAIHVINKIFQFLPISLKFIIGNKSEAFGHSSIPIKFSKSIFCKTTREEVNCNFVKLSFVFSVLVK